jgi:hypothetical protein
MFSQVQNILFGLIVSEYIFSICLKILELETFSWLKKLTSRLQVFVIKGGKHRIKNHF